MYGALLHADRRRIEKLIDVPEYMRILALAPYVPKGNAFCCDFLTSFALPA